MSGFGRGMQVNRPPVPKAFSNPGTSFLAMQSAFPPSSYGPPNASVAKHPRLDTTGTTQREQQSGEEAMEWSDVFMANLEWSQDLKSPAPVPVAKTTIRPMNPSTQQQRPVRPGTPSAARPVQNFRAGTSASTQQSHHKWDSKANARPAASSSTANRQPGPSHAKPASQVSVMPPPAAQTPLKRKVPVAGPLAAVSPVMSEAGENKTVRVFTGSVSHLLQWMALKGDNILMFVTIAKFEWPLPGQDKPTENWFVIGDHPRVVQAVPQLTGQSLKKIEAVYYNIDEPYMNPAAGSSLLCFGRFIKHKDRKDPVFQAIKMRHMKDADLQGFMRQFQQSVEQVQNLSAF